MRIHTDNINSKNQCFGSCSASMDNHSTGPFQRCRTQSGYGSAPISSGCLPFLNGSPKSRNHDDKSTSLDFLNIARTLTCNTIEGEIQKACTHPKKHQYEDHAQEVPFDDFQAKATGVPVAASASIDNSTGFNSMSMPAMWPKHSEGCSGSGKSSSLFPDVMHELLCAAEQTGISHIISWQPHGRSFLIHKPDELAKTVLPKYFRHTKITSFQRQLSLYGFTRMTLGLDSGAYYHPLFLQGRPDLTTRIHRTPVKGVGRRRAYDHASEPNFYMMTPCVTGTETAIRDKALSGPFVSDIDMNCSATAMPGLERVSSGSSCSQSSSQCLQRDDFGDGKVAFGLSVSFLSPNALDSDSVVSYDDDDDDDRLDPHILHMLARGEHHKVDF